MMGTRIQAIGMKQKRNSRKAKSNFENPILIRSSCVFGKPQKSTFAQVKKQIAVHIIPLKIHIAA